MSTADVVAPVSTDSRRSPISTELVHQAYSIMVQDAKHFQGAAQKRFQEYCESAIEAGIRENFDEARALIQKANAMTDELLAKPEQAKEGQGQALRASL